MEEASTGMDESEVEQQLASSPQQLASDVIANFEYLSLTAFLISISDIWAVSALEIIIDHPKVVGDCAGTPKGKNPRVPSSPVLTTERQFCRFARIAPSPESTAVYTTQIPEGGLCLSSFLILTEGESRRVLMGRLNPDADWEEIGALDTDRVQTHSTAWMLPSSHLMVYESPQEAAMRVLREQLGIGHLELSDAKVVSEVGTPRRFPRLARHWDFEFIFRGKIVDGSTPKHDAWRELRFIDLTTDRGEIARSHDEVLESAGFSFLT